MKQELSDYQYGIKEVRTDGTSSLIFARFLFSGDRNIALKALRKTESAFVKEFTKLVPVYFKPTGGAK